MLSNCVAVPPGGGGAYLYNDFKGPYKTYPVKRGGNKGESAAHCILSIACFGDITVTTAADNGNISVVSSVEYEYFNLFMFYSRTKIVVYGSKSDEKKTE